MALKPGTKTYELLVKLSKKTPELVSEYLEILEEVKGETLLEDLWERLKSVFGDKEEWKILETIAQHGPTHLRRIAEKSGVPVATASRYISELEKTNTIAPTEATIFKTKREFDFTPNFVSLKKFFMKG